MEEKYDPLLIISHVFGKLFALSGHQKSSINNYSIFIEIKESKNECYQIKIRKNIDDILCKGQCSGTSWRVIKNHEVLSKNKDFLGTVHIRFRNRQIKINNRILEPFPDYDSFWNYITK